MMRKLFLAILLLALLPAWAHARNDIIGDSVGSRSVTFAKLTTPCTPTSTAGSCAPQTNGTDIYCSDCQIIGNLCAAGGGGADARFINGQWQCFTSSANGAGPIGTLPINLNNVINVMAAPYSAKCDGVTADKAAIDAAIAAAPAGSTVLFPSNLPCKVTYLNPITRPLILQGQGITVNGLTTGHRFGSWAVGNIVGSQIQCTDTTHDCVKFTTAASGSMTHIVVRDLAISGAGSGSTVGLRLGDSSAHNGGAYVSYPLVQNVLVANFATGVNIFGQDGTLVNLTTTACTTGKVFDGDTAGAQNATTTMTVINSQDWYDSICDDIVSVSPSNTAYEINLIGGKCESPITTGSRFTDCANCGVSDRNYEDVASTMTGDFLVSQIGARNNANNWFVANNNISSTAMTNAIRLKTGTTGALVIGNRQNSSATLYPILVDSGAASNTLLSNICPITNNGTKTMMPFNDGATITDNQTDSVRIDHNGLQLAAVYDKNGNFKPAASIYLANTAFVFCNDNGGGGGTARGCLQLDASNALQLGGAGIAKIQTNVPLFPAAGFQIFGTGVGTFGSAGSLTGTLTLANATGNGTFSLQTAANTSTYTLVMPAAAPTASGMVLSSTTGGIGGWVAEPFTIGWDGDLGTLTNAAVKSMVAPCTGHFTSLSCVATLTGACTTPPTVNVNNVTGSTFGTATVLTTTVGTPVVSAQTLVFTAGNTIGLAQTATPGTCTVPRFACVGTATCP